MSSPQVYLRTGASFTTAKSDQLNLHNELPIGTYVLGFNPIDGWVFTRIDDALLPSKVYGNTLELAERIYRTYQEREGTTGVLLEGLAGTGKSLLTMALGKLGRDKGAITLVINQPFEGDAFAEFLQNFKQDAVIVFDEFEKVYDREKQNGLLTIFDGVYSSKKLFVLTANDTTKINQFMKNRPGRIFYAVNYAGLSIDFVRDYCNDNLNDKSKLGGVLNVAASFMSFSFDMLKALVEEMNRFNESATEAIRFLNIKQFYEVGSMDKFDLLLLINGKPAIFDHNYHDEVESPLKMADGSQFHWFARDEDELEEGEKLDPPWRENEIRANMKLHLRHEKLKRMDADKGEFLFETDNPSATLLFKRKPLKNTGINFDAL